MHFSHQADHDMLMLLGTTLLATPLKAHQGRNFQSRNFDQWGGGFLGTLNTMVIFLKVYINLGGHFITDGRNVTGPIFCTVEVTRVLP